MEKVFTAKTFSAALQKAKRELKKEIGNAHFFTERFYDENLTILNVIETTDWFGEIWDLKDGTFEVVLKNQ